MKRVSLGFSNWKINKETKTLYKVESHIIKGETREKLTSHLRFSTRIDLIRYLANHEQCCEDVVVRALSNVC